MGMLDAHGEPLLTSMYRNLASGITVALINIPLSISVAVASDVSPSMGCITMIWAGLICAVIGGSHFNIVGPTVALSGLISSASVQYGEGVLPLLAMMTGILSLLVFITNMDKLALFVSTNTMQGFKLAVGIIIAGNQINFALGLDNYPRHPSFLDNLIENLSHIGETEWQAVVMFFSFLLGQIALSRLVPNVPWSIVLVCIGILCGYLTNIEGFSGYKIRTLDSRYPGLTLSIFSLPEFKPEFFAPQTLYVLSFNAMSISFVAILETVISAK
jgi:SulP family sulfate permease